MKRVLSLIAILATFITTAVAQQAYCQLDQTTLTFYYGQPNQQAFQNGTAWYLDGDWNTACKEIVTDIVFDQSFANYEVTSCANWFKDFTILESVDAQYLNLNAGNINGMFNGCVKLKSLTIGSSFTFRNDQESDRLNMFNGCTALATGTLIVKGNSAPTISDGYFFQNIFDTDKLCTLITDPANLLDGQFGNDYEEGNKTFKRYKAGFFYRFNKATHAITIASSNLGTVTIDKVDGFSSFGDDVAAAGEKVLIDVSGIADGYELSELNVTYTGNDSQTHTIDITDEGFKQYSFTMVDYPVTVTPVFAIPKTPATVTTPPYSKNLTYNGQPQELVTAGVADGGTMQYSLDGTTYSTNIPTQTDAGDYPVYYKAVGDDTHNDSEVGTVSAYINTASSEVTTPPTGNTLPYTGETQELITAGVATGGTLVYKLEGGTYSESIPTATEAGEYTVYYKVDGDKNHDDTNEATITANISQPIPVYNINVSISSYPVGGDITYSGNRTAGETITLTITPDEGYELLEKNLTVSYYDSNNKEQTISYTNEENGTKSFIMPGFDVWVSALFTLIPTDGPYVELSDDSKTLTFKYGMKSAQNAWDLTDVDTWNYSCKSSVTSVVFDQTFCTVQPTSCHNWFKDFTYLESANLANLNTSQVTDFSYMFSGCSALTTLIISGNFTVTSTATITNMFYNVNATTLSVQGSTSPSIAQDIFCYQEGSGTFYVFNYARLETDNKFELDGIGVNEEFNLIEYKGGLFDTYNDYHRIEYTGWGFQIDYTPKIATPGTTVTLTCSNPSFAPAVSYFDDQGTAVKLTLTEIEGGWTFKMPNANVTIANAMFQGILQLGQDNKTLTILALEQDEAWNSGFPNIAEYVQCQRGENTELTNFVTTCQQNVEKVIIDKSVLKVSRLDVSYLFNGFSKLTSIEGLDNINMQRSHSTENMFAGCENLESLTIGSNFYIGPNDDGYSITDMFKGCDGLANGTLIVKGTTPPVIEQYIFSCFTSGTLMTEPIDLLDYSVTRDNMGNVYYCGGTFTKFNSTDEPYVSLSSDGTTLTFINGEKPTTGQVWDLTAAWSTATNGSVTTVAFDESFKNVPITSCEGWFSGFTKLTTVDARFLNLGRCSSTKEMFADCSSLNDLTIGDNFFIGQADTYNTTDMFKGCTAMASGTVTIVNTSPASGMYPIINQDIFNVITSGTLMTGNGVDLSTLVEDKDDGFKWLGGNFTTYNGQQKYSIRPADPTQAASKDNPYIISNVDDMVILSKAVNAGEDWTKNTWIKIATANEVFDFDGITDFEPIGTSTNKFTSSFDGNGVTIKNLNLTGTTYTGVFGYASGGWTHTIENIRIDKSSSFASSGNYLGSLAGYTEGITITNCHNDGAPVAASGTATEVGGLIGYMLSGTISDCSSNANVSGYTDVGGLMGHAGYGNGKVEMNNNTVGMALGKDETISITATAGAVGAMVGSVNSCSGTGNYYNGQAITAKQGAKELTGYGFGISQTDNAYIMSATGGLFAAVDPGHTGKTLKWSYDLSTKTFTIAGTPDPGYELTSVTISYKDANGDVQKLVRSKEELDKSWTFEVQNYPTNVEATCETALKLADPTQPASKDNPYLIYNVQDMVTLSKAVNANQSFTKNTWFKVAKENDVFDFDGITDFEPIGTSTNKFTSRFDGNGVTIKNLNLTGNEYVGLFGCAYYTTYTQKSEISNITIDSNCSFTANTNYAGAFVASTNYTDIINCHNMGATVIATTSYAGGIVAQAGAGTNISGCTSNANVTAKSYAGGIAGSASATTMTNNLVGIDLAEGETITINCSQGGGAIVSYINNVQGSNNFYNGMAVILNAFNTTYQGQGYAYWRSDNDVLRSATEGYFPAITGHQAKGLTWNYNLYTKAFTIIGSPDPGYELTSVTISYKDTNGDVQELVRSKEQLDESWTFEVQNYPTNVEAICETALKLADPTQPASKDNPYLINNVNDMVTLSKAVNANQSFTKNTWFKVAKENDVFDFDGITDFEPIGTSTNKFTSSFDGNGVTIKNLKLTGNEYVGLFGCAYYTTYTEKSKISNITIDASCSFTANTSNAGAFVASTNYTDIINCHNMGATVIATTSYAGGIVAQAGAGSTISGCTSKANVTSNWYAGGIAGLVSYATMTNNLVGMGLEEDETITINCSNGGGAIVSNINNVSGSDNFYNGMAVILNSKNTTYQGQGYAYWRSDNDFLKSATGGYCGVTSENSGNNVEWKYDLYTKDFTVFGTGATADYTASMAPSIVKDEIETLTISEGVTGIGAKAFSGWTSLNTVTFDGCTLTSAASDAFDGCTAMAEGTVIVNKTVPMAADVATDFWNIVTGGRLQTAEGVDLGDDVTRDGDVFLWKSGAFSSYKQMRSIAGISFSDDKHWATFYTKGESLTAPENVTVYVVDAIEDNEVTISAIDYIPAGVGVLLYSETPATSLSTTVYTGSEKNCSSLLEGAITETTLQREAGYILLKDEFVLTSGGKLPAHRCYLPISNNNARQKASRMRIKIGEGTTAIESLDAQIRTVGEGWYTIDGRKLDEQPIRKGLYIHNGKKVFVK